ncbi:MarR family winged helix-turn-helix transcriptional regulator [Lutibacter sp. A80]|uniref:MarR family winged helix-turn-helix transcriptional regulator n=1 Tax=Lutibacter sp. A80 TaxID=2918453 RepID=UPI001F051274|nr:MarR family winged helix-turn-helix transcriptional regulator [Lutibacter sp. A80]UMB61441.1 MarR family winged helix-turn-helix transcriptional regulator [Lutibacter sp. A80]
MFLEHSIFPWIGITAKMHASYINKVFKDHTIDLTKEQFVVLKVLSENNGKPQNDIALITESDKTSFSRLMSTMEKKGLITRKHIKADKRVKNIYLTNLGKEMYATTLPFLKKTIEKLQKGISNTEIAQAIETIKKIQLNITQEHSFKL